MDCRELLTFKVSECIFVLILRQLELLIGEDGANRLIQPMCDDYIVKSLA